MNKQILGVLFEKEKYGQYYIFKFKDIINLNFTRNEAFISNNKTYYSIKDKRIINDENSYGIGATVAIEREVNLSQLIQVKHMLEEKYKSIIFMGNYDKSNDEINIIYFDLDKAFNNEKTENQILNNSEPLIPMSIIENLLHLDDIDQIKYCLDSLRYNYYYNFIGDSLNLDEEKDNMKILQLYDYPQ